MKAVESDDPFELVAVHRPSDVDEATDLETARCLIEEYALNGFSASEILELFAAPAYSLPHAIQRRRGARKVRGLVARVFGGSA